MIGPRRLRPNDPALRAPDDVAVRAPRAGPRPTLDAPRGPLPPRLGDLPGLPPEQVRARIGQGLRELCTRPGVGDPAAPDVHREVRTFLEPSPSAQSGPASERVPVIASLKSRDGARTLTLRVPEGARARLGGQDSVTVGVLPDGRLARLGGGPSLRGAVEDGTLTFGVTSGYGRPARDAAQTVDLSELFAADER